MFGNRVMAPSGHCFNYLDHSRGDSLSGSLMISGTATVLSALGYLRDTIASSKNLPTPVRDALILVVAVATIVAGVALSLIEGVGRLILAAILSPLFIHSLIKRRIEDTLGEVPQIISLTAAFSLGNITTSTYLAYKMLRFSGNLSCARIDEDVNGMMLAGNCLRKVCCGSFSKSREYRSSQYDFSEDERSHHVEFEESHTSYEISREEAPASSSDDES